MSDQNSALFPLIRLLAQLHLRLRIPVELATCVGCGWPVLRASSRMGRCSRRARRLVALKIAKSITLRAANATNPQSTEIRSGQFQQRVVDVQAPFKADTQLSKACKQSVRALHHPAMFSQPFTALDISPCNPVGDASWSEIGAATLVDVAFVRMQLRQSLACLPWQACNGWDCIHALLAHH